MDRMTIFQAIYRHLTVHFFTIYFGDLSVKNRF